MTTSQSAAQTELDRAAQTFHDALESLPLSEPVKRVLIAAASSWAKASANASEVRE